MSEIENQNPRWWNWEHNTVNWGFVIFFEDEGQEPLPLDLESELIREKIQTREP